MDFISSEWDSQKRKPGTMKLAVLLAFTVLLSIVVINSEALGELIERERPRFERNVQRHFTEQTKNMLQSSKSDNKYKY